MSKMDDLKWKVVDAYFASKTLVSHHRDSYDAFVQGGVQQILAETNPLRVDLTLDKSLRRFRSTVNVWFGGRDGYKVRFGKPVLADATTTAADVHALFPNEARLRDLTYAMPVFCDIEYDVVRILSDDDVPTVVDEHGVKVGTDWQLQEKIDAEQAAAAAAAASAAVSGRKRMTLASVEEVVAEISVPPLTQAQQAMAERTLRFLEADTKFLERLQREQHHRQQRMQEGLDDEEEEEASSSFLVPIAEVIKGIAAPDGIAKDKVRVQRFALRPNVQHLLMHLPIMVQSRPCILHGLAPETRFALGECRDDVGGYFIVDGKEKTLMCQETFGINTLLVELRGADDKMDIVARIKSVSENVSKLDRTLSLGRMRPTSRLMGGHLRVSVPNLKLSVPLFILFRALGLNSDSAILETIMLSDSWDAATIEFFRPSIEDAAPIHTQSEALVWMARDVIARSGHSKTRKTVERVQSILADLFLAHVGETNWHSKALFLGHMVRELFLVAVGAKAPTDRDHFKCKRVATAGALLRDLVRENFVLYRRTIGVNLERFQEFGKGVFKDVSTLVERKWAVALSEAVDKNGTNLMQGGVRSAFKGGYWGVLTAADKADPQKKKAKLGFVQELDRLSFVSHLAHMRKLILPIDQGSKLVGPRVLHMTQHGIIDPIDSPDGGNVGVHKALAMFTAITVARPRSALLRWLRRSAVKESSSSSSSSSTTGARFDDLAPTSTAYRLVDPDRVRPAVLGSLAKIMVNGLWYASTPDPLSLVRAAKAARRGGADPDVDAFVSVAFDIGNRVVVLCNEGGRLCSPLFYRDDAGHMSYMHPSWSGSGGGGRRDPITWDAVLGRRQSSPPPSSSAASASSSPSSTSSLAPSSAPPPLLEYVDTQEREYALVSVDVPQTARFTHQELDGSALYGIMSNLVNYLEHNPVTRNTFSAGQTKQAVSVYASNHRQRMDKTALVLEGGQLPLTQTRYWRHINGSGHPCGVNARVAIMCYSGYNVEDALLINEAAVARGLFRTAYYTTYVVREETAKSTGDGRTRTVELTEVGPRLADGRVVGAKPGHDYSMLDERGIVRVGTLLHDKVILVGLTSGEATSAAAGTDNNDEVPASHKMLDIGTMETGELGMSGGGGGDEMDVVVESGGGAGDDDAADAWQLQARLLDEFAPTGPVRRDRSVVPKKGQSGVVVRVYVTEDVPGRRVIKVKVLSLRNPAMGDKFASRAGQKGTIGRVVPDVDMPFFPDGTRPDIVVNPHAIPSRMTLGHLLEMLSSAAGAETGHFADCTAYASGRVSCGDGGGDDEDAATVLAVLGNALRASKLHSQGVTVMHSGVSGQVLRAEVFAGTTYYMRLKHMVADKINYRARGRVVDLTRQPNQGRAEDGGLRVGEMERDVLISHGMSAVVDDAMMTRSDAYRMAVCNVTGTLAVCNPAERRLLSLRADGPVRFQASSDIHSSDRAKSRMEQVTVHGRTFSMVDVPYALKTFVQELGAGNVGVSFVTSDAVEESLVHATGRRSALRRGAEEIAPSMDAGLMATFEEKDFKRRRIRDPAAALVRAVERALRRDGTTKVARDHLVRRVPPPLQMDEEEAAPAGDSISSGTSSGTSSGSSSGSSDDSSSGSSDDSSDDSSSGSSSGSSDDSSDDSISGGSEEEEEEAEEEEEEEAEEEAAPLPINKKRQRGATTTGGRKGGGKKQKQNKTTQKKKQKQPVRKDTAYHAFTSMHPSTPATEFVEGDMVHLRSDPLPARLWSVDHIDALGRLTVRTKDARMLRMEDTARVVELRDVIRPDISMSYGAPAPEPETPPALGTCAAGGVNFAPVINIVTTGGAAADAAPSGKATGTIRSCGKNGNPSHDEIDFGMFDVVKK